MAAIIDVDLTAPMGDRHARFDCRFHGETLDFAVRKGLGADGRKTSRCWTVAGTRIAVRCVRPGIKPKSEAKNMRTIRNLTIAALVAIFTVAASDETAQAQYGYDLSRPPLNDKSDLRRWLRRRLAAGASNREERRIRDGLKEMSKNELQALASSVYRQQLLQASAASRRGYYPSRGYSPYYPRRNVTYVPQVTWLPSGVSLGASAVVSPDRRHVRMSLSPTFFSIPRVDTYNLKTGKTRRIR